MVYKVITILCMYVVIRSRTLRPVMWVFIFNGMEYDGME